MTLNGIGGESNDESVFGPVCIGAQPKLVTSARSEDLEDLFERARSSSARRRRTSMTNPAAGC